MIKTYISFVFAVLGILLFVNGWIKDKDWQRCIGFICFVPPCAFVIYDFLYDTYKIF